MDGESGDDDGRDEQFFVLYKLQIKGLCIKAEKVIATLVTY